MSIDKGYGPLGLPESIVHAPRWCSCCLHFHQDNGDLIYRVHEQWPWFHFSYMESLSISLQSSVSQWATEGGPFFLLLLSTCMRNVLTAKLPVSKILYMPASLATVCVCVCVPPPLLCICEVCVCACVSTWMYLNLLLFTPIEQLCLRGLLWSNWMSWGKGKPVAANVEPAGLIICNTAAALACAFSSAHEYRNECGGRQRWTQREETDQSCFNQLPDRTITLSTSTAQRWISV